MRTILVTGGYGFIGSNFIRYLFRQKGFRGRVVNLDKITYAANPDSLKEVTAKFKGRCTSVKGDICDFALVEKLFRKYKFDCVVHFAAESHVDRSIYGPKDFVETNIHGTFSLLEAARNAWGARKDVRFHHISTDEVYGSLGSTGKFKETTPYDPRSPYSASKAASDHLVMAYHHTYGLPVTISNCSNNYGPYQFPEKLLPVVLINAIEGKPLPIYGDGKNVRDWLYVEDHCSAIWRVINKGRPGRTYNVGGDGEMTNIDLVRGICDALEKLVPSSDNKALNGKRYVDLITYVKDRPGHDRRYAIDFSRIRRELGWQPSVGLAEGLCRTVAWYLSNWEWVTLVRSGEYRKWVEKNYGKGRK